MSDQLWEVIGGADTGGVVVRDKALMGSKRLDERLACGSIVRELEQKRDRLNYVLVEGHGPTTGWISLNVNEKTLAVKCDSSKLKANGDGINGDAALPPKAAAKKATNGAGKKSALVAPHPRWGLSRPTIAERCLSEVERDKIEWSRVDITWVNANHDKRAPGLFYGLEFPWNEEMLIEMGAAWLTKAFQAAGTLEATNAVTAIVKVKRHVAGNNGGKTLFEVTYKDPAPDLHTKLFAKYPFDMNDKKQMTDSLAQRVYKQPQDFTEVNFYRLMETNIPFKTPKFYFGDISNISTNFMMITEQVDFNDPDANETAGASKSNLPAGQIEGPYDKALDFMLRGNAVDYYYVLMRKGAIMAALHKTGKLAPEFILDQFENTAKQDVSQFGLNPGGNTGDPQYAYKLKAGESFMFEAASKIFPPAAMEPGFRDRWRNLMLTANAYNSEVFYYLHGLYPDYIGFTHQNLNVDNAFFWRDEHGVLDCGIFDWGNIKAMGMGHMFYWWVYTSEWAMLCEHVRSLIDCFIDTYREHGGPELDKERYYRMYILAAIQHQIEVIKAVPLIYKMVSKATFPSIETRTDDRIFASIDGKSTCRVYLHCWSNMTRMILDWDAEGVFWKFVEDFGGPPVNYPAKDIAACYG